MESSEPLDFELTAEALRLCARKSLHSSPADGVFDPRTGRSWSHSDFDLNPELLDDFTVMPPARKAAVLVPIILRPQLTVLLTKRAAALRRHAGQIAFPGGRMDDGDETALATALREAEEEVGLPPQLVEPLGYLDGYRTVTGFEILPIVGLISPELEIRPDPNEVASVFEVPLSFLMSPANLRKHAREWQGRSRHYYAIEYGEHYIWGATAGMLKNLHERLFSS